MVRSTLPLYPSDDGWPYPDEGAAGAAPEPAFDEAPDLDHLDLAAGSHAWDALSPMERAVVEHRFGFLGEPESLKEVARAFGCTRAEARDALVGALGKLRAALA